ncbi:MAG: 8-oxo-dGTP diphosphatase MutT [Candidatus Berkiellales bacterium]
MSRSRVQVAVGVIYNQNGQILVAKRQFHQHQGECWEFPGGKIEAGESVAAALKRELLEEVGIKIIAHEPWLEVEHDYEDKAVCLQVHKITAFSGEAQGREGQEIKWLALAQIQKLTVPCANETIIKALSSI